MLIFIKIDVVFVLFRICFPASHAHSHSRCPRCFTLTQILTLTLSVFDLESSLSLFSTSNPLSLSLSLSLSTTAIQLLELGCELKSSTLRQGHERLAKFFSTFFSFSHCHLKSLTQIISFLLILHWYLFCFPYCYLYWWGNRSWWKCVRYMPWLVLWN